MESISVFIDSKTCKSCLKCVRKCPVEAIKVIANKPEISEELCVHCGSCLKVCPTGSPQMLSDAERVKEKIAAGKKVFVSLSSTWPVEFPDLKRSQLIVALKKLGFAGVSEAALGSQEVAAHISALLNKSRSKVFLSSVCPVVVESICKYYPQYSDYVLPLMAPQLAHAFFLKQTYGENIEVVFLGPCLGAKNHPETNRDLLTASLTFPDIHKMFSESGIEPQEIKVSHTDFVPKDAAEGGLVPLSGGMIDAIRFGCKEQNTEFRNFSGIENLEIVLKEIDQFRSEKNLFIELMACPEGCINGPAIRSDLATPRKIQIMKDSLGHEKNLVPRVPMLDISTIFRFPLVCGEKTGSSRPSNSFKRIYSMAKVLK